MISDCRIAFIRKKNSEADTNDFDAASNDIGVIWAMILMSRMTSLVVNHNRVKRMILLIQSCS